MPRAEEFGAGADGVGPGVGIGADVVAVAHAELGTDPEFVAGAGAGEPAGKEVFGEREIVAKLRGECAAAIGDGDLAMLAVEGAQVEHLRVLNQFRPDEQAARVVGRQHVFRDGEVRVVPSHGEKFARGAAVKAGDLVEFLGRLGGGVAVGFEVNTDAECAGGAEELDGDARGGGGRRVMIEQLNVNETDAEVALGAQARQGIGDALRVEAAHEAQAVAIGLGFELGCDEGANAVEAGVGDRADLASERPLAARSGVANHRPRGGTHNEARGGAGCFHE